MDGWEKRGAQKNNQLARSHLTFSMSGTRWVKHAQGNQEVVELLNSLYVYNSVQIHLLLHLLFYLSPPRNNEPSLSLCYGSCLFSLQSPLYQPVCLACLKCYRQVALTVESGKTAQKSGFDTNRLATTIINLFDGHEFTLWWSLQTLVSYFIAHNRYV